MGYCNWDTTSEANIRYHDNEWGMSLHDDRGQFEFLMMEVMQCGLNWNMMINKREIFRGCFDNFEYDKIAAYDETDIERILKTEGMIRSRRKIEAVINNARCFQKIREEYGSFSEYLWAYSGGKTILYQKHAEGYIPVSNGLSDKISRDLKKRGFKYLGTITVYSHLQACGIINDHDKNCPRYKEIIEKVCQSGYRPTYNPDDKLNLEAMLPCAFARSVKMMRFINEVYDGDKERFYLAWQKSSRKNSRFISANRIEIRLNAIKAQGVYMASLEDEELSKKLLEQAERSFSRLANLIKDYGKYPVSYGMILQKFLDKMGGSDDGLHDFTALFIYFCNSFNQQIDETDANWRSSMIVILDKEKYNLTSFGAVEENIIEESGSTAKEMQRIFAQMLPKALPGKSFAEMWDMLPGQKEANFYQMLWNLGQLDGYSLSMFENEKLSSKELRDITNVITVRSGMMQTTKGDLTLYYIVGILLRSIFRGYKEVTDMIDEYSGIVRESEKNKKLASMAARQNNRILELEQLNMDKQEKLNESQKEIDKLRKLVAEQEEQIKHDKERIAILEQVVAEEEAYEAGYGHDGFLVREGEAGYTSDTTKARSANVIVFGGPDKWQSQVISQAPQYTCVSVDNNTFDKKNIKGADAVVFKTDYLSHKQWYAVRDYAKKCGRKIIYCRNNIPMMFEQIERALK